SFYAFFFFSSRRRHTRLVSDWSSDVCSSDLSALPGARQVTLRSVGVAGGEVRGQIAEIRGLGIERALLVLPRRDDLVLENRHGFSSLSLPGLFREPEQDLCDLARRRQHRVVAH